MSTFKFLSQYIVEKTGDSNNSRHIFYRINEDEIINAEERLAEKFPNQLKEFYLEIGYGFLCTEDKVRINRLMHPDDIADFYCDDEIYAHVDRDMYESDEMIFFDLGGEGDFLTLKINGENLGAVYYFGRKIADTLKGFIEKMDLETNYYI